MKENNIIEDEIDLKELFKTIWNKKYFILSFTLFITVLSAIYVFNKTPIYEVKSVVRIGFINDVLVEDSFLLEKKLRLIFNVDSKNNQIKEDKAIVSNIYAIKKLGNFLEITTQGFSNSSALKKNKEVVEFLKNEYKFKIDEYIINVELSIKNIEEKIEYLNKVERINLLKSIEIVETQSIPKIDEKIKLLKETELKIIDNKLRFNIDKLNKYEDNLLKVSKQKSSDNTQNMLMAMQILNTQNLILNLQNTIENLKKEKENLKNIVLRDLEVSKKNLVDETIRKLKIKLDIDLVNKLNNLKNQLEAGKRKLNSHSVKNSEVVGNIQVDDNPIKPKKDLIIVVSFITAFILSIFLVFFIQFIKGFKEEKND